MEKLKKERDMSSPAKHQDQAVTFFFEAEKTLRDYGHDLTGSDFSDLDDSRDHTNLLISALVMMVTLCFLVGVGVMWFIQDNVTERSAEEQKSHYAYVDYQRP